MKKFIILVVTTFGLLSFNLSAQEADSEFKTLLPGEVAISGFGGPMMNFTSMTGNFAHFMGGGGGLLINKSFFIGGYGMGKTNTIKLTEGTYTGMEYDLGHGGFWLGYNFKPNEPIHPVLGLMAGWGEIAVGEEDNDSGNSNTASGYTEDGFFTLMPSLEIEANITRYFKIGAGVNYQYFVGIEHIDNYNDTDFSNVGAVLHFKFGGFSK